jgi:hypothetical protein
MVVFGHFKSLLAIGTARPDSFFFDFDFNVTVISKVCYPLWTVTFWTSLLVLRVILGSITFPTLVLAVQFKGREETFSV